MEEEENIKSKKIVDIRERTFAFAVRVVKLCKFLENKSDVSKSLINQLLRAGTSIGANLEEAVAGQSKSDFIHRNSISLKEARESNFWLRLILETSNFNKQVAKGIQDLEAESLEIAKIIGSIVVKMKR
ncbi:MAG: four helix bundle protein [Acidobacteriota bacterium]|nr:four helix bundle protein [Acidobacteriota bacterium]